MRCGHVECDPVNVTAVLCSNPPIQGRYAQVYGAVATTSFYMMNQAKPSPKTPPSPMSRASSLPTSTPISNKVSSSHIYASQVLDRTKMNVALAKEMEGHFLGGCPPQRFLDKYLPLKAGITSQELRKDQLKEHFNAVAWARSEFEMYQPFVRAFNNSYPSICTKFSSQVESLKPLVPGMVFVDTHSNPDTERDRLAPDIAGYHKDDRPDSEKRLTDFPKMSSFVELKKSENADPFCDVEDPLSAPPGFRFERPEQAATENRGQIGSYSAALSGSQFRVHILSVSICGPTARFIRWDRAGAIVTRSFNYLKQPHILADFFWRYSHLDRHQQGYDLTVSVPSNEEIKQAMLYECRLRNANPAHREFRKLMVPERDNPDQEHPFLISSPPYYASRSPFSRATRGFLAFDLTEGELVFLKDYWRPDVDDVEKEGSIYAILEGKAKVPNIAPFGTGDDVRDHKTLTQTLTTMPWAIPTENLIRLRHYRMTLKVIGRRLTEFRSSREFLGAIADAMEGENS
jgi:hypothetical protein